MERTAPPGGSAKGEFCWVELATPDKVAALAFYTELFGWRAHELEMGLTGRPFSYAIARLGGRDVGAVYEMVAEQRERGVAPHWLPYVAVESVDRVVRKAEDLGATCLADPVEVFHTGRMSILEDPTGATFALWQAKSLVGFEVSNDPGSPCSFELTTASVKRAVDFYGALFGWARRHEPGAHDSVQLTKGNRSIARMTALPTGGGEPAPRWTTCFAVASCEASCERIQRSGGSVERAPTDVGGLGRSAAVIDPHGAAFSIFEPDLRS